MTEIDQKAGRIRLPRPAKRFFPSDRGKVEVVLRGTRINALYDPRVGPDQERSGVLTVGKNVLQTLVAPDEQLTITRGLGGVVHFD